jgi:UPF0271 protein
MSIPTDNDKRKAIVLDTSAFVAGFDPFSIKEEQYTVPMVKEEITKNTLASFRLRTAIENGKIRVKTPNQTFVEKVKTSAKTVGDAFFLSQTDIQVLALALELKANGFQPLIASDDYSIQNVANQIDIKFISLATFGIRLRLEWIRYCPACHKRYPSEYRSRSCRICGTELKRKPVRKRQLT